MTHSTNPPIGVAIVGGAGGIGRGTHLPAYHSLPQTRLLAVCDANADALAEVHRETGVAVYTDYARMLSHPGVDMVDVCSPDSLHATHTIQAARAGKHVLCEKPMAMSVDEAQAMKQAAHENGVKLMIAMCLRWRDPQRRLRELIDQGRIGRVVYASYRLKGAFYSYAPHSVYRKRESKGQFLHNGPHYMDVLCWLCDSLPRRVYATSTRHYADDQDRLETDNYTSCLLRFESGALGWVEQNLLMVNPRGFPTRTTLDAIGTTGTLHWDSHEQVSMVCYRDGRLEYVARGPGRSPLDPFRDEIAEFVRCIRDDTDPPIPVDHSIRVLGACLGALESADSRRAVAIST